MNLTFPFFQISLEVKHLKVNSKRIPGNILALGPLGGLGDIIEGVTDDGDLLGDSLNWILMALTFCFSNLTFF